MPDFELVIRNGTVVSAADSFRCDVGIQDGKIAALAAKLGRAEREIDAEGKLVLPGGIDSHCHIEQESSMGGVISADDFFTGTRSAAFGGNTTIIPFACQHRGKSVARVTEAYGQLAAEKAVIDYAFHLIVTDPTETVLKEELPALFRKGCTSFKIYMTYELMQLKDYEVLEVMSVARREGAMLMVHAENWDIIRWFTHKLLGGGYHRPKFHAVSHPRIAEGEATHRVISLAELIDLPVLIVHVSSPEAIREIRDAQQRGLKVYGETCPQYLFLTAQDLDQPGSDGAKFCCSPPPRDEQAQQAVWEGIVNGTFQVFSSDHCPYRYDSTGKLAKSSDPTFKEIPNGVPGIELRLPLLFSEGVRSGRIDVNHFVALAATNAAKLYGLYPRKGTIGIGSDADIAIWDQTKQVRVTADALHDNVGYTPYEGRIITGWPTTVINRGRIVVVDGKLCVERGSGKFLPCDRPDKARPLQRIQPELDPARNFGAQLR
jgi:dihydropyrimidinase